jgi:hypothetical protein
MPFKSGKQRKFLWAKHPKIARKWAEKYGSETINERISRARKKKVKLPDDMELSREEMDTMDDRHYWKKGKKGK